LNTKTRQFVLDEIKKLGFDHIPSQANFLMIDVKQPVRPLIDAMSKLNVQVGRAFPSLPNHMRVTIGKQDEMEAFMSAFKKVALTTPAITSA
jgi:histidinol-phosphate aminotransferase